MKVQRSVEGGLRHRQVPATVAHMNDGEVLIPEMKDVSVLGRVPDVPTARGVIVPR